MEPELCISTDCGEEISEANAAKKTNQYIGHVKTCEKGGGGSYTDRRE